MILVTGGSGLIGSALIKELLRQGRKVRALVHKNKPVFEGVEFVECSLLDVVGLEDALEGIDEIYNCAGLVSYAPGMSEALSKVNVEGVANLMNVALDARVRKVVHVSSIATLQSNGIDHISESSNWVNSKGKSAYAISKHFGEMEVWRSISEGLNAVIVNPSIVLGAGDWNTGSTSMFKSVYNNFPWFTNGVTGYVDVNDVVKAMIGLMESDISEERFVLSGHNVSYQDVFSRIAIAFGKQPPHREAKPYMAGAVWRMEKLKSFFSGKTPLLTKETAAKSFEKNYYNGSKILTALQGFSYTPLEETINRVAKELQQKLNIS